MRPLACLSLCATLWCLPVQAATELITLNYRTADEVAGIVQSMLEGQGKVSTYGNQLVVNAPPAKIEEVRAFLNQLDTPPRRLMISVDSSDSASGETEGYRVDGSLSAGNGEVVIGRGEIQGRDQVRIIRRSTDSRSGGIQQIQATEGYPALIQVGHSVPLTNTTVGPYGQVYQQTQYQSVTRGFYVTASLSGQMVHLSISSHNDRLSHSQPGVIDVQSADTRVSGRLGEWIQLGGVSEQSQQSGDGFLRRYSTQGGSDSSLRIKVDALD